MEVLKVLEDGMEVPKDLRVPRGVLEVLKELKSELEIGKKSSEGPQGPWRPQGFARCLQGRWWRSPRSIKSPRVGWESPRRVVVVVVPKELRCGLEALQGWTEVLEVLGVPKGGTEMGEESAGRPQEQFGDLGGG